MIGRRRTVDLEAIAQLPDAIELVIVGVRAGMTPSAAFELAAGYAPSAVRPAFAEVVHRLHRGQRLADALDALTEQIGPAAAAFSDAFAASDRYGLPIEPVLDRLATEVRVERRRHAERRARTLPVRLSFPLVVCTLPSFVLLAIVPALLGALATLRATAP